MLKHYLLSILDYISQGLIAFYDCLVVALLPHIALIIPALQHIPNESLDQLHPCEVNRLCHLRFLLARERSPHRTPAAITRLLTNILLIPVNDDLQARHEATHQTDEEPAQVISMVLSQGGLQKDFQA